MIEVVESHVVFDNPRPMLRSRHGYFPGIVQLPSGELRRAGRHRRGVRGRQPAHARPAVGGRGPDVDRAGAPRRRRRRPVPDQRLLQALAAGRRLADRARVPVPPPRPRAADRDHRDRWRATGRQRGRVLARRRADVDTPAGHPDVDARAGRDPEPAAPAALGRHRRDGRAVQDARRHDPVGPVRRAAPLPGRRRDLGRPHALLRHARASGRGVRVAHRRAHARPPGRGLLGVRARERPLPEQPDDRLARRRPHLVCADRHRDRRRIDQPARAGRRPAAVDQHASRPRGRPVRPARRRDRRPVAARWKSS